MNFRPMMYAPVDGTEVLARWSDTEHGHQYAVIYYVRSEKFWFCGDIPVACMDCFCDLPKS